MNVAVRQKPAPGEQPNPLRELACGPLARVVEGYVELNDSPGIGINPDTEALMQYAVGFS